MNGVVVTNHIAEEAEQDVDNEQTSLSSEGNQSTSSSRTGQFVANKLKLNGKKFVSKSKR